MRRTVSGILCLALLLGMLAGCGADAGPEYQYKVGLIAAAHEEPLLNGLHRAAGEDNAELLLFSQENGEPMDPAEQIHQAVSQDCQALILSGVDPEQQEALEEAAEAGIRFVSLDSAVDVQTAASFATDHRAMGATAGQAMLEALAEKRIKSGAIGILSGDELDEAAREREAGFREVFQNSGYTLLDTRSAGTNTALARSLAWQLLSQDAVGIYGNGAECLSGIGQAARDKDNGSVIVGFGYSDDLPPLLEEGYLRMTLEENRDALGYEAMKAAVAALQDESRSIPADADVKLWQSQAPVLRIQDYKIALIARDQISREGRDLADGVQQAAKELGCQVVNLSPMFPNQVQQRQAVADALTEGYFALIATADDEAVAEALHQVSESGTPVIGVASAEDVQADVRLSMDDREEGRQAAEAMLAELETRGILEGNIGIIQVSEEAQAEGLREAGFREAFEGTAYTLLDTQYSQGDAAKSHAIADSYIFQKAVGIFCCSEGGTLGAGNAAKARQSGAVILGCGTSEAISALLAEGYLFRATASDARALGYEAVKAACALLGGEDPAEAVTGQGILVTTG